MRTPSFCTRTLSSLSLSLLCRCPHCYPVFIVTVFIVALSSLILFSLSFCFYCHYLHCIPIAVFTLSSLSSCFIVTPFTLSRVLLSLHLHCHVFYCHSIYIVTCFSVNPFTLSPVLLSLHLHCHPAFIAHFRYASGIAVLLLLLSCFYLPCVHYHSLLVATRFPRPLFASTAMSDLQSLCNWKFCTFVQTDKFR